MQIAHVDMNLVQENISKQFKTWLNHRTSFDQRLSGGTLQFDQRKLQHVSLPTSGFAISNKCHLTSEAGEHFDDAGSDKIAIIVKGNERSNSV